jgi:hypothetical protein
MSQTQNDWRATISARDSRAVRLMYVLSEEVRWLRIPFLIQLLLQLPVQPIWREEVHTAWVVV